MSLGSTADKLQREGVETLAVVATAPSRARLYFRFRPSRIPVGADPELVTHRAYGLSSGPLTPEVREAIEAAAQRLAGELKLQIRPDGALQAIAGLDGWQVDASDGDASHAQLIGQFLVDGDGIVRWANVECARDGLAGIAGFPTDEDLLAAARSL